MVLVARGCCAGDDSWVRAFFADRGCLIGRATDSSSSDACGDCRFPLDRVVCLVTRLVTASGFMDWLPLPCPAERDDLVSSLVDFEVDFLFAEVAEDGFRAKVGAMITYFGRRNVWGCLYYYGGLGRLNQ